MQDVLAVPASGPDVVRNFVVPIEVERMRYVAAVEIRPGNAAVHHAVLAVDRTSQSRAAAQQDQQPGFPGMTLGAAMPPDGHFMGWTPGKSVRRAEAGLAWRLYPGDDFVLQLHAVPVGKVEQVQPEIGIWFTDQPTRMVYDLLMLFSEEIDIAPGDDDFVLRDHLNGRRRERSGGRAATSATTALSRPETISAHSRCPPSCSDQKRMSGTCRPLI